MNSTSLSLVISRLPLPNGVSLGDINYDFQLITPLPDGNAEENCIRT